MIRRSHSDSDLLTPLRVASVLPSREVRAYGTPFWLAYVANTLVMVAISLLFRYADFVTYLGGTELHLGWIVGVGMVGSLVMRLAMGVGIDRYGPRVVWLGSVVLFASTCFAHVAITSYTDPAIYLLRIAWCCAVAGIFGASMTFISHRVPVARLAEMLGMLGTAGFLGMVLGTQLGDLLLGSETIRRQQIEWMFLAAGLLGSCSAVFAYLATRGQVRPLRSKHPAMIGLLRRYHPGPVLLVGVAMGIGLGLPGIFLRTYAADLDIHRIGLFFGVYAPTAIATRLLTRRLPERFGTKPMILVGITGLVVGQLLFLLVGAEWQLVVPGVVYGFSHAVMFPSVVAAGSHVFPSRHRGLGTTLILGTFDAGQLVGAPTAGAILHCSTLVGLPSYPTMFVSMAAVLAAIGVFYAVAGRRGKLVPGRVARVRRRRVDPHVAEPATVEDECRSELV